MEKKKVAVVVNDLDIHYKNRIWIPDATNQISGLKKFQSKYYLNFSHIVLDKRN